MINPFQALLDSALKPSQFPPTSRYYGVKTASHMTSGGKEVVCLLRRFVPSSEQVTVVQEHRVSAGERLDHLSAQYLGDPEQYWRLCDANDTTQPDELVERPGSLVNIALPNGMTGVPGA